MEKGKIQYDRYRFSALQWLRYLTEGSGLGIFVVWLCYHAPPAIPAAVPIAVWYAAEKRRQMKEERKKRLGYHFKDFLASLHTALTAGYSVEKGVAEAWKDVRGLYGEGDELAAELRRMTAQLSLQIPVETLFAELGERSGVEDIQNFAEVLAIAKRTGGRMDQILEEAGRTIRERIDTEQEIEAAQAARRYEQQIMSLVPVGIILYLRFSFHGFVEQMYGNLPGVLIMSICLAIYICAFWLGKRIVRIQV